MLSNIRGILNRRSDQSRTESLSSRPSEENVQTEGFVCPTCFLGFPTAEALQNHYESSHSESINDTGGDRAFNCPACRMKLGSEIELQSHYTRHHTEKKEEIEIEAMSLQVKALEEGKTLLQSELQAVRTELLKENMKIREEREGFKSKANKLTDDLATVKLQMDDLKANKLALETSLKASKDKIKELEIEIQQRPAADDVTVLKQEIVTVQKIMNEMTRQSETQKEDLQKKCNDLQDNYLKLQAEKLELENFIKSCPKKEDYSSLQKKISEMSSTVSQLQRELNAKEIEKNKLQTNLEKFGDYEQIKASLVEKISSLEEIERLSAEKDSVVLKLREEVKSMTDKIEEMKTDREKLFLKIEDGEGANAAMFQLKEENARLQEQLIQQQNVQGQSATKNEEKLEELRSVLKKANLDLQESNKKCSQFESHLNDTQCQIEILQHDKESLLKELENHRETANGDKVEIKTLKEDLRSKEKSLETKTHQIESLSQQLSEVKASVAKKLDQLHQEKKKLEEKSIETSKVLSQLQETLVKSNNKVDELEQILLERNEQLNIAEQGKLEKEQELDKIKDLCEATLLKIKDLENVAADFEVSKNEFCNKISLLNEELVRCRLTEAELNAALEDMSNLKTQISEKCTALEEENKNLRQSITSLQNEKNSLLSDIEEGKKSLSDLKEKCKELENKTKELEDACEKEKANSAKVLKEANLAKDHYIKDKLNLQKQIESLENDCAKQLSQNQETVKKLENQLEEMDEKSVALQNSMEETKKILQQRDADLKEKEAQHAAKVDVFTQNIKILREDLSSEQKKRESIEQKYDEVCGTKYELEAKLENAISERNTLLDRCVKSEVECERQQKIASDVTRKYNDCVAALQELGRENQTLQVENMKHITRKWADDSEVTHCTACGKLFTVTIRKHHCRNCGSIFCNECSAKSATVAASKKPVRVCDVCFDEVTK